MIDTNLGEPCVFILARLQYCVYGRSVSVAANYALHWLEMTGWNAHRSLLCQNIVCYEGALHMGSTWKNTK